MRGLIEGEFRVVGFLKGYVAFSSVRWSNENRRCVGVGVVLRRCAGCGLHVFHPFHLCDCH